MEGSGDTVAPDSRPESPVERGLARRVVPEPSRILLARLVAVPGGTETLPRQTPF